jgi:hypothetical protein
VREREVGFVEAVLDEFAPVEVTLVKVTLVEELLDEVLAEADDEEAAGLP